MNKLFGFIKFISPLIVFLIGSAIIIFMYKHYSKYKDPALYFKCINGFWQVTIDQKTQPIFIQPDGVIIPLVCNQPKE